MARLTCAYCNNIIRRSDIKCPYCGAETGSSLRKFMEARKSESEKQQELLKKLAKIRRKHVIILVCASFVTVILSILLIKFSRSAAVKIIVFAILLLAYSFCLVSGIRKISKNNSESRDLNDRLDGLSHNIIFDCEEVQPYKMINDAKGIDNEGCFKKGFQQIAFKVSITNGSSHKVEFSLVDEFFGKDDHFGYHVRLNADGVRMEDCKLKPFFEHHEENDKVFEPALYTEGFRKIVLREQESIVGWVAFYVTAEAVDLELLFADDLVLINYPSCLSEGKTQIG